MAPFRSRIRHRARARSRYVSARFGTISMPRSKSPPRSEACGSGRSTVTTASVHLRSVCGLAKSRSSQLVTWERSLPTSATAGELGAAAGGELLPSRDGAAGRAAGQTSQPPANIATMMAAISDRPLSSRKAPPHKL